MWPPHNACVLSRSGALPTTLSLGKGQGVSTRRRASDPGVRVSSDHTRWVPQPQTREVPRRGGSRLWRCPSWRVFGPASLRDPAPPCNPSYQLVYSSRGRAAAVACACWCGSRHRGPGRWSGSTANGWKSPAHAVDSQAGPRTVPPAERALGSIRISHPPASRRPVRRSNTRDQFEEGHLPKPKEDAIVLEGTVVDRCPMPCSESSSRTATRCWRTARGR